MLFFLHIMMKMELGDKHKDGQEYTFNDEDLSKRVLRSFYRFKETSSFCDVILKICGYEVPAHSCVLAAGSQYFNSFLSQPTPRQYSPVFPQVIEIQIDGSDPNARYKEAVYSVIDFIYTGKLIVHEHNILHQIREISKIMQLTDLVIFCSNILLNKFTTKSVTVPRLKDELIESCSTSTSFESKMSTSTQTEAGIFIKSDLELDIVQQSNMRSKKSPTKLVNVSVLGDDYGSETEEDIYDNSYSENGMVPILTDDISDEDKESKPDRICQAKKKIHRRKLKSLKKSHMKNSLLIQLTCDECEFTTEKTRVMAMHKDTHLSEKNICRFCDLQLESKGELTDHVKLHGGIEPYVCTFCNKTFKCRFVKKLQYHLIQYFF